MIVHTILYVKDQKKSMAFYKAVLGTNPVLDVPGMTEFKLSDSHILGLMPEQGIKSLLGDRISDPTKSNGVSRAELYIRVGDPDSMFSKAIKAGAKELSPISARDWGTRVGYAADLDGHVLAFSD